MKALRIRVPKLLLLQPHDDDMCQNLCRVPPWAHGAGSLSGSQISLAARFRSSHSKRNQYSLPLTLLAQVTCNVVYTRLLYRSPAKPAAQRASSTVAVAVQLPSQTLALNSHWSNAYASCCAFPSVGDSQEAPGTPGLTPLGALWT